MIVNAEKVVNIYVRVIDGEVGVASTLAPKIDPLGLSPRRSDKTLPKRLPRIEGHR